MKTIVVTGANRGLGLEFARQFSASGDRVIATARHPEDAQELRALDVRVEPLDVSDPSSVRAFAAKIAGEPVDMLINNAGKGGGRSSFEQTDWADVAAFFEANSIGPMRVAQALLPNLRLNKRRLIASVTSRMGSIDDNSSGGAYGYRASKAALNMFNKSLSIDLATEGFTCLVLHPGWVRTDMGGAGSPLEARDSVADMVKIVNGATSADSGRFIDHDGATLPW